MTEQDVRRKKNNKVLFVFLMFFVSILLTGVSADVDSLTCFFGLQCDPNPLTGNANITLKEGLTTEFGGTHIINCSAGSFVNGWTNNATPFCAAGGSGSSGVRIVLGVGLNSNQTPITDNASLYLKNATALEIGGIRAVNCSGNNHVSGLNSNMEFQCSGDAMNGTLTSVTCDEEGVTCNPTEITTAGMILLKNATTTTIGGSKVLNCSSRQSLTGWAATNTPSCTDVGAGRGIFQINYFAPLTSNSSSPLYDNVTLMVNNATTTVNGVVGVANCTGLQVQTGWSALNVPRCGDASKNGLGISQLTYYSPITSNESSPIYNNATLMILNATTTANGIIGVSNCSVGSAVTGFDAGNVPRCTAGGTGTVTSISAGNGVSVNPNPITTTGTVMGLNASAGVIGVSSTLNCSGTDKVSGWAAGGAPTCSADSTGSGESNRQPYFGFTNRIWGRLQVLGTTATTFTATNIAAFVANGTVATHALNEGYYIRFTNNSAVGKTTNGTAGITQTAIQTQGRYRPILRTSIMTNATNGNIREYFGLASNINAIWYSRGGTFIEYAITYDTNASNTAWQCCSNDGGAGGKSCTAIAIDHTTNTPYNLTLNLTNIPTDFTCQVQNATAISTITKSSNLPSAANNAVNLGIQNILVSQQATGSMNYSIRYIYLETN